MHVDENVSGCLCDLMNYLLKPAPEVISL